MGLSPSEYWHDSTSMVGRLSKHLALFLVKNKLTRKDIFRVQ